MTCKNCNAELLPEARFCPNCGAPCNAPQSDEPSVEQPTVQPTVPADTLPAYQTPSQPYAPPQKPAATGEHPYRQLDGFLMFLSIVFTYVSPIILSVGAIALLIRFFTFGAFGLKAVAYVLLSLIQSGVGIWFSLRVGKQIKERKPIFLCTYQQRVLFSIVVSFFVSLVSRGLGSAFASLIGSAVGGLLLNLYFIKSVRVRTYMGTDEYLKQSLFNRNTQAPPPADGGRDSA